MPSSARRGRFAALFRFTAAAVVLLPVWGIVSGAWKVMLAAPPTAEPLRLVVHRVQLERLAADHADLSVQAEVIPGMDAELKGLRLSGVHLDHIPVYVDSVDGHLLLRAGVPLEIPRARMVVYYADLPKPSALDDMLAAHRVQVTAEVRAQLQLSVVSKLLMGDLHPVAALSIDEEAPFDEAAVDSRIQAGVGLLSLAQQALGATTSIAEQLTGMRVSVEGNSVSNNERLSLLLVRTSFHTRQNPQRRVCERLGLWLDERQAVVPAEALKPWAYALDVAEAMAATGDQVDPASVETVLLPFSAQGSEALPTRGDAIRAFLVQRQGVAQESRLITPMRNQITVLERGSPGNYAVLRIDKRGDPNAAGTPVTGAGSSFDSGSGTMRVYRYGAPSSSRLRSLEFDVGSTAATASRLLPRPVDATVFGSPVLLNGAVVGMVTSETTWIPLQWILSTPVTEANTATALSQGTPESGARHAKCGASATPVKGMAL